MSFLLKFNRLNVKGWTKPISQTISFCDGVEQSWSEFINAPHTHQEPLRIHHPVCVGVCVFVYIDVEIYIGARFTQAINFNSRDIHQAESYSAGGKSHPHFLNLAFAF